MVRIFDDRQAGKKILEATGPELLGFKMPGLWLEPFGSLLKNIPLIPAVLAQIVLSGRR